MADGRAHPRGRAGPRRRDLAAGRWRAGVAGPAAEADAGWEGGEGLRALCGGEALPADLAERLLDRCSELWNVYGPTETTIWSTVERVEMGFWKRALDLLIDPNIIALMLSVGLIGIVVELWNPGLILPGTVGAISLIVGLYGLQVLPVSAAGLLLMALAARMTGALASGECIARLGGDEFAALVSYTERAELDGFLDRICAVFAEPFAFERFSASIGANIGIARAPQDGTDADTLLARADLAMYRAKSEGRNRLVSVTVEGPDRVSAFVER